MMRYTTLSDLELVTMAEALPIFQEDGIAREVLLRLANAAHHPAASSDTGRIVEPRGMFSTAPQRRRGG